MTHNCESCSVRYSTFPKTPCKISNNRFFRNFPPPIETITPRVTAFPMCHPYESPLPIQTDPLLPAGTNRPKRKNSKMVGKKNTTTKRLTKKRVIKSPSPINCPSVTPAIRETSIKKLSMMTPCVPPPPLPQIEASHCSEINKPMSLVPSSMIQKSVAVVDELPHAGDCSCNECDPYEPNALDAESFVEGTLLQQSCNQSTIGDGPSSCTMSKSEKQMSNFLYDNASLRESITKKVSGCAEVLDCLDEDSEVWILQCPRSFDLNKVLNSELGRKSTSNANSIDVVNNRFKSPASMICLTPEKAAEYKSICDGIRLVHPVGKIMVTEAQQEIAPAESCSEEDQNEEDCVADLRTLDSLPLASKKIQKKLNDQKFTIETTVTVESCNDRSPKKSGQLKKQSIKQESNESCLPLCPPQPQPMKRKKKC